MDQAVALKVVPKNEIKQPDGRGLGQSMLFNGNYPGSLMIYHRLRLRWLYCINGTPEPVLGLLQYFRKRNHKEVDRI